MVPVYHNMVFFTSKNGVRCPSASRDACTTVMKGSEIGTIDGGGMVVERELR